MIRPVQPEDAAELAALYAANREFLARHGPTHPDEFFTADGQRLRIQLAIATGVNLARAHPFAILDGSAIAGTTTIFRIRRGARQSCSISFWVDRERNGRGLATGAVEDAVAYAFGELALRRVLAATVRDDTASQRVLEKTSFERIGDERPDVVINGEGRDFVIFERIAA